jgi:hypothetical protein
MVSQIFLKDFADTCDFFGISNADELESFKVLCRGNMDAAETFVSRIAKRVRADPRFGVNERIHARILEDKQKALDKKKAEE